jgi:hypothetical protein
MIDFTFHPTPRFRDVVREQIRTVGLSLRIVAIVAAVVIGTVTILMLVDLAAGRAETWFDSEHWIPLTIASSILPFAVWLREKPFGSALLWTLPVDRRRLALSRVFAGWVWLMTALTILMVWEKIMGTLAGVASTRTLPLFSFAATTTTYLLGSALLLSFRYPLRWVFGAGGVLLLLPSVVDALGQTQQGEWRALAWPGVRWAIYGPYGLQTLLSSSGFFPAVEDAAETFLTLPGLAQLAITTVVCCGFGLAVLWLAALRHRESR